MKDRRVTAQLTVQGVRDASREANWQQVTPQTHYLTLVGMLLVISLYVGPFISFPVVQLLPVGMWHWAAPFLATMVPVILFLWGLLMLNRWDNRRALAAYDRSWASWNIPDAVTAKYEIADEGFRMSTARGEFLIFWHAIARVAKVAEGWMIQSDLSGYFIPSKAFEGTDDEKRFLAQFLARLEEPAMARSTEASEYVKATASPEGAD